MIQSKKGRSPRRSPPSDRIGRPALDKFGQRRRLSLERRYARRRSPSPPRYRPHRRSWSPRRRLPPVQPHVQPQVKTIQPPSTPLIASIGDIYAQMTDKNLLPEPTRIRKTSARRDQEKWCDYHKDHGHTTDECRNLKMEIKKLIQKGHLGEYVDKARPQYSNRRRPDPPRVDAAPPPQQTTDRPPQRIATIAGGPGGEEIHVTAERYMPGETYMPFRRHHMSSNKLYLFRMKILREWSSLMTIHW